MRQSALLIENNSNKSKLDYSWMIRVSNMSQDIYQIHCISIDTIDKQTPRNKPK